MPAASRARPQKDSPVAKPPSPKSKHSTVDQVVGLAKRRGFVYPCGEIYGGTRSAWDYGPLGVELKENIKRQWWRSMVQSRDDVVGLDSSVILPRQTWEASGHVATFTDPLTECQSCHKRFRADHLQEAYAEKKGIADPDDVPMSDIACPNCGSRGAWTEPRQFSGLLKTYLGVIEDESGLHYLRPETAQGIFLNFANVVTSQRMKPPFGIAQIGKSFRNEITPGNFIFRTREFEQMEMEFFVKPGEDEEWHQYWIDTRTAWYTDLGIDPDNLRHYEHAQEKLSHYSKRTVDIEYRFNFAGSEWGELEGIANRTDFDLSTHAAASGKDLSYFDQAANTRYVPYVIEPAAGLSRSLMTFLVDAYAEDEAPNTKGGVDKRTVLRLDPRLSPVKVAVLPLSRNEDLTPRAKAVATELRGLWNVDFDDAGAIGKRYRRQDEIGTPYCVTVDFDTLDDQAVTVRDRDTMSQERVALDKLTAYFAERLVGC
ncbi:glycine--tRNA ligase [Nocardioides albidus]|uniref:Glycine--tRNA ligase n=1 Tax=Nocardioides albidus TaxID=1517589 RepID=A0A5C4VZA9_9ACTN|nr:glycine--tRNA ligase [Nocardioides albidus]